MSDEGRGWLGPVIATVVVAGCTAFMIYLTKMEERHLPPWHACPPRIVHQVGPCLDGRCAVQFTDATHGQVRAPVQPGFEYQPVKPRTRFACSYYGINEY